MRYTHVVVTPCSLCNSEKPAITKRTIQSHLKRNQAQLQDLIARSSPQQTIDYLQDCFDKTTRLLASLAGGSQGSSQSSHPDGVYLFYSFYLAFNHNSFALI
jgi:hypothetical protein